MKIKSGLAGLAVAFLMLTGCSSTIQAPEKVAEDTQTEEQETGTEQKPSNKKGSATNPAPVGTVVSSEGWELRINHVALNATGAVLAFDTFNEEPKPGNEYMLVNYTLRYVGDSKQGVDAEETIEFVAHDGTAYSAKDSLDLIVPDQIVSDKEFFPRGSTTGATAIEIPAADASKGMLAVTPAKNGGTVYVGVRNQ